jgi:hypothetical protein
MVRQQLAALDLTQMDCPSWFDCIVACAAREMTMTKEFDRTDHKHTVFHSLPLQQSMMFFCLDVV